MADRPGIIPHQLLAEMMELGYIKNAKSVVHNPAAFNLTLTDETYRLRGSYLPKPSEAIEDLIQRGALYKHPLDRPLEVSGVYLIRLAESLALPKSLRGSASSKVSMGSIHVSTRLLADRTPSADTIPAGYTGSLWLEIISHTFPLHIHPGDQLTQLRLIHGEPQFSGLEHRILAEKYSILSTEDASDNGMPLTLDLLSQEQVGWRARPSAWSVLDTAKRDHDPLDFFEPVIRRKHGELAVTHGSFFLLNTKEPIHVPPTLAAELTGLESFDSSLQSFQSRHCDPGWNGSLTLEISNPGPDTILRDGQAMCRIAYQRMLSKPDSLVPRRLPIATSVPRLAKWFKT